MIICPYCYLEMWPPTKDLLSYFCPNCVQFFIIPESPTFVASSLPVLTSFVPPPPSSLPPNSTSDLWPQPPYHPAGWAVLADLEPRKSGPRSVDLRLPLKDCRHLIQLIQRLDWSLVANRKELFGVLVLLRSTLLSLLNQFPDSPPSTPPTSSAPPPHPAP